MANLSDKQLIPRIFVGGIGLILLGIGIGGLASLPSTLGTLSFAPMGFVMGSNMMMQDGMMMGKGMDMDMAMMRGFATPFGPFGINATTALNAYLVAMIGIYAGLIAIGGYLIYRAVAPIIRISVPTAT